MAVKHSYKIRIYFTAIFLLLAPCVWGQLQVGENTTLNLNALASLGWSRVQDGNDIDSLTYGFNGNLTGDYYDPRFLSFAVNPFLNQSRLNSTSLSTSSATGVNALANFLSSSQTPVQVTYSRDHNSDGTFSTPAQGGSFRSIGDDQAIGINASYLPEDWPSLHGNFSHAGSTSDIIGLPGTATSHTTGFGLSSGYELLGTQLTAGYNKSYVNSQSPLFAEPGQFLNQDSNQDTFQVSASRRLFDFANLSSNFARSHVNAEYEGFHTDATYDTVGASLGMKPTQRTGLSFNVNYSSNLNAQFLSSILGGSNGVVAQPQNQTLDFTSHYLSYGTIGSYNVTHELTIIGNVNHQVQGQPGFPDFSSTNAGAGATWSHQVLGGTLGAQYGFAYSFTPGLHFANSSSRDTNFLGQTAGVSYSHSFLGWSGSGSFSYARSLTTVLVGYVQSNYAGNGSITRNLHGWGVTLSGAHSQAHIEASNLSDSTSTNGNVSLSHKSLGLTGNYSRNNGSALQVGNSLVPVGVPILPNLLRFNGEAWGAGASYSPVRRLSISGSYSRVHYDSINFANTMLASQSASNQFFVHTEYNFRQVYFNAGYSHLSQGFGIGSVLPATINTVYFGISRRFDFF